MLEHRNTTATVRAVLKAAEDAGVNADQLLREAGIDSAVAHDPDGEVTLQTMKTFWETAYKMSGDPYLALNAGVSAAHGSYKTIDYLLLSATTLGEGLGSFIKHLRLINTWLNYQVEEDDSGFHLVLRSQIGPVPFPAVEVTFAILVERCRKMHGNDWSPLRVDFLHVPSGEPGFYRGYFRCPVNFSQETARLSINREEWNRSLPSGNEGLFRVLVDHAALLSADRPLPDDLVARAQQEVLRSLSDGVPEIEEISATLGVGVRTLQRRLSDQVATFSRLVDQVRQNQAVNLVTAQSMSLSEIAYFLGFSDQSAFSRAFKRWTGETPKGFRSKR